MGFLSFFKKSKKEEAAPVVQKVKPEVDYSVDEYFNTLVTEENFPGYKIERNVHVNVFNEDAHPRCFPITYLFSKDDEPVLAVFLMNYNQYHAMISEGAYEVLMEENINYIRFYRSFPNEKDYVINRIKENL